MRIFYFFLLFAVPSKAQTAFKSVFKNKTDSLLFVQQTEQVSLPTTFGDSATFNAFVRENTLLLHAKGYLETSLDNGIWHIGKPYQWLQLKASASDKGFLSFLEAVGFRKNLFSGQPLNVQEIAKLEEKILKEAENNGYPFAKIKLDSLSFNKNNDVSAVLNFQKGQLFFFDTLNTTASKGKINRRFLEKYLSIRPNFTFYSKEKILGISKRINELAYLQESKPPTVTFRGNKAVLNFFMDNRKASSFDFLIGVLPTTQRDGSQKFNITGTFNADFQNQLNLGERLQVVFEQLKPQSPRLDLKLNYPYILNFPFGIEGALNIYRQDTTFLDTRFDIGLQYFLPQNTYLKAFFGNVVSTNLSVNEATVIATRQLPATLDVSSNQFGIEYNQQRLDYRFNPRKGFSVSLQVGTGQRKVERNLTITSLRDSRDSTFNFSSLYDTIPERSFQYLSRLKGDLFLPFAKRSTLRIGIQSAWQLTQSPIFRNEQARIGGNRVLRGFDEESIFATRYAALTLEYRLLVGKNAYFFCFADGAYIEDITRTTRQFNRPLGLGAGLSFETKVGIFGFNLAVGKQLTNSFDFRDIKTHFGYVSLF